MHNNPLEGDTIVLAGATGRVGGATLAALLRDGAAAVAVLSRSVRSAQDAIDAHVPEALRERAFPLAADLGDFAQAEAAVAAVVQRCGRIDAAVSLAGGGTPFMPLTESTPDDLAFSLRNNVTVAYNLMLPALRAMLTQKAREGTRSRGRLVAVSAGSSLDPQPDFGLMGVGKAGVNTLMRAIAREHKADGIVANAIVLGGVATEAARSYLGPEDFAAAAAPEEVANVLAFHASDRSSGINGELVHLNAREVD